MLSKVHSTRISRISRPAMLYIHARKCYVIYVVKIWIFWVKYDLISDVEKLQRNQQISSSLVIFKGGGTRGCRGGECQWVKPSKLLRTEMHNVYNEECTRVLLL